MAIINPAYRLSAAVYSNGSPLTLQAGERNDRNARTGFGKPSGTKRCFANHTAAVDA
jgi:hypothetical protein